MSQPNPPHKPQTLNDWSLRSEAENLALFAVAVLVMLGIAALVSNTTEAFIPLAVAFCAALGAFFFANARRTKRTRR